MNKIIKQNMYLMRINAITKVKFLLTVILTLSCTKEEGWTEKNVQPKTETNVNNQEIPPNQSKDWEEDKSTNISSDEYYVHYVFPEYGGGIKYRDTDGSLKDGPAPGNPFTHYHGGLNITIGPVKKGFNAYLSGTNNLNTSYHPTMKIQVSKNNSVMVDKGSYSFSNNGAYTLSYTIDF